jgi:hypothetical protein
MCLVIKEDTRRACMTEAGCILRERIILMLLVKKRKYKVLHGSADIQIDKSNESLVTSSKTSANYNPIFH